MPSQRPQSRDDFEVAIICALPREHDAVCLVFDEIWDDDDDHDFGAAEGDPNCYLAGRIGGCNVVLVLLPKMGKTSAASAAAMIRVSYRQVQLALLVGVCGGAPNGPNGEIILGDVVISKTVVQYDYGRRYAFGFARKDTVDDNLGRPSKRIRNLLMQFETTRVRDRLRRQTAKHLRDLQLKHDPHRVGGKYEYKGMSEDRLYLSYYQHKHRGSVSCACGVSPNDEGPVCDQALSSSCKDLGCQNMYLIHRRRLQQLAGGQEYSPMVHLGAVASGDTVMKSAVERDRLASDESVLVFEMEGAGVWDELPCIIIKGICDYADSHKNKGWQDFAAATAAAAAKAILGQYKKPPAARGGSMDETVPSVKHHTSTTSARAVPNTSAARAPSAVFNGPISGTNVVPAPMATHGGSVNLRFASTIPEHQTNYATDDSDTSPVAPPLHPDAFSRQPLYPDPSPRQPPYHNTSSQRPPYAATSPRQLPYIQAPSRRSTHPDALSHQPPYLDPLSRRSTYPDASNQPPYPEASSRRPPYPDASSRQPVYPSAPFHWLPDHDVSDCEIPGPDALY